MPSPFSPFYLQFKPETFSNACISGWNFVNNLANGVGWSRVVNRPTSPCPNPARTRPEPESISPNLARTRKLIWSPNHARKKRKVKLGLKNLVMLPNYVDYIFVLLRQKVLLKPELSPKFLLTLGPNPARTRREKRGPTYNSGLKPH